MGYKAGSSFTLLSNETVSLWTCGGSPACHPRAINESAAHIKHAYMTRHAVTANDPIVGDSLRGRTVM